MRLLRPAGTLRRQVFHFSATGLLLALLGGCASGPPLKDWPETVHEVAVAGVPYFAQEAGQCGPATLAEVLHWSGVKTDPQALRDWLYVPEKGGSLQPEMLAAARRNGRVPYVIPGEPQAILQELEAGHPVLILQNNGLSWYPFWHYAVVIGADDSTLTLRSGDYETLRTDADVFMRTWRRAEYWGIVVLPENRLPVSLEAAAVVRALNDYAQVKGVEQTEPALSRAFLRWPHNPEVALAFGNIMYGHGERDRAISIWRSGLAGDESLALRNNLAWALAERGELDEARALIEPFLQTGSTFDDELAATRDFIRCLEAGNTSAHCE